MGWLHVLRHGREPNRYNRRVIRRNIPRIAHMVRVGIRGAQSIVMLRLIDGADRRFVIGHVVTGPDLNDVLRLILSVRPAFAGAD